jgi:hypothetical protein
MEIMALLQLSVYKWITTFKHVCTSVTDEEQSESTYISTIEENNEGVHATILDNQCTTIDEVVHHLHNSHGSPHGIIQQ